MCTSRLLHQARAITAANASFGLNNPEYDPDDTPLDQPPKDLELTAAFERDSEYHALVTGGEGFIAISLVRRLVELELFRRYSSGMVTLATLAAWLNDQGFRTRNTKKLPDGSGGSVAGPRLFTSAAVRHILHNAIYCDKVRHKDELRPGVHEALVSEEVYETVQVTMRRNSGRSRTLQPQPQREYLLKGLIQCAHCRMPMWAQTFVNGRRYYREQKGSRGAGYCVGRSGSMLCAAPDEQIGEIVSAIVLPDAWVDRVLGCRDHRPPPARPDAVGASLDAQLTARR